MIETANLESMPSKHLLQGWGVSVLLHALLVGVAITALPHMTLIVEKEPFKWDVALVERVRDVISPETPAAPPTVQPPKPAHAPPPPPVEPPSDMVMTPVAPRQSVQMVHPVTEPPKPAETVQEIVQTQPKPVEREEVKKVDVKEPEVVPVMEPVAPTHTYQAPAPVASHHETESHSESVAVARAPAVSTPEPTPASHVPSPAVETATAVPSQPVAVPSAPVTHEPALSAPVVASAPAPRPMSKADYTWLVESLGRRIAALTRYPSSARLNGWEGKVVLKAIIRADGHLLDVTVHRSSGHEALDRAALETIKLACPLHMKHALNSAEVAVYVPIVYSLAG